MRRCVTPITSWCTFTRFARRSQPNSVAKGGHARPSGSVVQFGLAWDNLFNNEPLRQGRHRGKSGSALRDATEAELTEARRIALAMIEAYLRHLDTATRAGLP